MENKRTKVKEWESLYKTICIREYRLIRNCGGLYRDKSIKCQIKTKPKLKLVMILYYKHFPWPTIDKNFQSCNKGESDHGL